MKLKKKNNTRKKEGKGEFLTCQGTNVSQKSKKQPKRKLWA